VTLTTDIAVRGLHPVDHALLLCYHGMKNQWRALKYVADFSGLLRSGPDCTEGALIERARQTNSTRVLALGFLLAHKLLHVSLSKDVQNWISEKPIDDIADQVKRYLDIRAQVSSPSFMSRIQLQLGTKDTLTAQLRYGAYSALRHVWSTVLQP
jgi:hypothetical protein